MVVWLYGCYGNNVQTGKFLLFTQVYRACGEQDRACLLCNTVEVPDPEAFPMNMIIPQSHGTLLT